MTPRDKEHVEESLEEEKEAISDYGKRLKTAKSPKVKRAIAHARKDEKEHAARFRYLGHFGNNDVLKNGHNTSKMETVMHEFKRGKLHSGSKKGPKVKSRAQAIAIGLSEARKAGEKVPRKPKR